MFVVLDTTPLCPVGHLPLKGGDQLSRLPSPIANVARGAARMTRVISPLEGEMSDRTEGGIVQHQSAGN
ncbi:lytic murein transglycosylase [Salmonella enterica subsp. enterica]|nr:lytic murein transglycosylase [Salmonella enterica subsp. enterica serovar Enteritidis]